MNLQREKIPAPSKEKKLLKSKRESAPLRLAVTSMFSHFSYISFAQELHRNTITPERVSENPPVRVNGVKNGRVLKVGACGSNEHPI